MGSQVRGFVLLAHLYRRLYHAADGDNQQPDDKKAKTKSGADEGSGRCACLPVVDVSGRQEDVSPPGGDNGDSFGWITNERIGRRSRLHGGHVDPAIELWGQRPEGDDDRREEKAGQPRRCTRQRQLGTHGADDQPQAPNRPAPR